MASLCGVNGGMWSCVSRSWRRGDAVGDVFTTPPISFTSCLLIAARRHLPLYLYLSLAKISIYYYCSSSSLRTWKSEGFGYINIEKEQNEKQKQNKKRKIMASRKRQVWQARKNFLSVYLRQKDHHGMAKTNLYISNELCHGMMCVSDEEGEGRKRRIFW